MKKILNHDGFTLIELLIVIAVLGVLAGGVLIAINPAEKIAKAKDSTRKTTISQLANAVQSYYVVNASKYPVANNAWLTTLVNSGEIKSLPPPVTSPCTTNNQNGYCYKLNSDGTEAMVYTSLETAERPSGTSGTTPYFLWSSADGQSGTYYSISGDISGTGTSGFTFGSGSTLTQGLIGWWKMNGDASDSSGNGNNGTVAGATLTANKQGQFNQAYNFSGTSPVITVPNFGIQIPSKEITISVWVRPAAGTPTTFVDLLCTDPFEPVAGNDRMNIHFPWGTGGIIWQFGKPFQGPGITFNPSWVNVWGHYVFESSFSGNFAKIYKDGVQIASSGFTNPYDPSVQAILRIGGRATSPFQGDIDDLRIYNRAVSVDEIQNLFSSGPQ